MFENSAKKGFQFRWWYILIAVVIILIAGAVWFYVYINSHVHQNPGYVSGWNQLSKQTKKPAAADSGKDSLDSDDFTNIKQENYPIIQVKQKDPNIENILLIGEDGGDPGQNIGHRSDSMMVATINKKDNSLKLTSILRDIKTYFPDLKEYHKLNASFAYGGPGQTVNIINYAFKLDIQKYLLVDFSGFKNIIDAAGGVSLSVTNSEATQIPGLTKGGTYNLNGAQALAYSRIRHIDTDFKRTERQRTVLISLYNKTKGLDFGSKVSLGNQCLNYIKTNIPTTELFGNLMNFTSLLKGDIQQLEVPTDGNGMYTVESKPIWYFDLNWDKEVPVVQQFIYG